MIATLIIHAEPEVRLQKAGELLATINLKISSPDVLIFEAEEKFGVEEGKEVVKFLHLKSYAGKSQAIIIPSADKMTVEAQNSLLKTLEEHGENVLIILGAGSEDQLLPTIISRCQIIRLTEQTRELDPETISDIENLMQQNLEKRFQFIEKLDKKEEFLEQLTLYFRQLLSGNSHPVWVVDFLQDLLEAEKWHKHNVNIRAILEYLMLKMPRKGTEPTFLL